jgi:phosphoribosylamine--glycine ligase
MDGEELSLFVITDGLHSVPLMAAQDHKRLLDGDFGPNTGGMGAYAPTSIATPELTDRAMREIVEPTLATMRDDGGSFTGLLYTGLMVTDEGP